MKLKINYKFLTGVILFYPLALGLIFLFNINPFSITAPYFFLLLLLLFWILIKKERVTFHRYDSGNLILLAALLIVSILNFSSLRYSLPILFCSYILVLYWYLSAVVEVSTAQIASLLDKVFGIYLLVSLVFLLFLPHTHMEIGNRFIGFTGSPTTYSAVMATLFIFLDAGKEKINWKRLLTYGLVLLFVYLSKTRLILLFLLLYPFLLGTMIKKKSIYRMVFLGFFLLLFSLYSIYGLVVEYFPELITLRYEDGRDASFGLRYHLFEMVSHDFFDGNMLEKIFGKGNEYSRLLVESDFGMDIYPHNDFYRLLNDWGILGALVFFLFLYRVSGKNRTTLLISLLYLLLFYSNLVFNLFMISILLLASFLPFNRDAEALK